MGLAWIGIQAVERHMKHFDNIISLGYFCSVALELERLGMRSTSSPFDWSISSFEGVIAAIGNRFDGFLDYDLLLQSTTDRKHYFNSRLGIWFYHDFDEYHSLKKQLGAVADKYRRRIDRFYEDISRPTLFIRYISDEVIDQDGKSEELAYIEHHYEEIVSLLRSFNEKNEIIFLANTGVESDSIHIYPVCPDENDTVARRPFEKNGELYDFLMSIDYRHRSDNLRVYYQKQKRAKRPMAALLRKLEVFFRKVFSRPYIHEKQVG